MNKRSFNLHATRRRIDLLGHMGDVEPVGQGISELRIPYGPGYRISFQKQGNTIIVLYVRRRQEFPGEGHQDSKTPG